MPCWVQCVKRLPIEIMDQQLLAQLDTLRTEHRDLDDAITALQEASSVDQLQITRMKKRKLALKDTIARIESRLIPDLDA